MAWMLEARELSPYYFVKRIMSDIFSQQATLNDESRKSDRLLTDAAESWRLEALEKLRENPQEVTFLRRNVYSVHSIGNSTASVHTVDISLKHCGACMKWDQTGVPCHHAFAVLTTLGVMNDVGSYHSYFHRLHMQSLRQEMYTNCQLNGFLPDDNDVLSRKYSGSYTALTPVLREDKTSSLSKLRIHSTGDLGNKGRSRKPSSKSKVPCSRCGKLLKFSTQTHEIKACLNWQKKRGLRDDSLDSSKRQRQPEESMLFLDVLSSMNTLENC
jgi:hypothetical protein